jgi:hypothetical protein
MHLISVVYRMLYHYNMNLQFERTASESTIREELLPELQVAGSRAGALEGETAFRDWSDGERQDLVPAEHH